MSSLNGRYDNRTKDVSTETLKDLYHKSIKTGQYIKEYMIEQQIPPDVYVSGQPFTDREMFNLKMANKRGSSALEQSHLIDSSRGFTFSNYVDRAEGKPIQPYSSFTDGVYMDVAAVQGYYKSNSIFSMGNAIDQSNKVSRMNQVQQNTVSQTAMATPAMPVGGTPIMLNGTPIMPVSGTPSSGGMPNSSYILYENQVFNKMLKQTKIFTKINLQNLCKIYKVKITKRTKRKDMMDELFENKDFRNKYVEEAINDLYLNSPSTKVKAFKRGGPPPGVPPTIEIIDEEKLIATPPVMLPSTFEKRLFEEVRKEEEVPEKRTKRKLNM